MLVPFVGSGSECVAAAMEGRGHVGFELNPDYVAIARSRLADTKAEMAGIPYLDGRYAPGYGSVHRQIGDQLRQRRV